MEARAPSPPGRTPPPGNYTTYLRSRQWERLRDRLIRHRAMGRCELCGAHGGQGKNRNVTGLNVHHLTYERLGNEHDEDLVVLCRTCHERLHGLPPETPARSLKAIRLATSFETYEALVSGHKVDARDLDAYWLKWYGVKP